jgi:hypothetical protein
MSNNTVEKQRQRILDALRVGPLTSIQAIEELDILRPAARVFELRGKGYKIHTHWSIDHILGRPHRVASYVMMKDGLRAA